MAREMATKWRVFASKRTGRQRDWSAANLQPAIGNPRVLLYPFGGPDLLHAMRQRAREIARPGAAAEIVGTLLGRVT